MNAEFLFEAFGEIRETWVEEAAPEDKERNAKHMERTEIGRKAETKIIKKKNAEAKNSGNRKAGTKIFGNRPSGIEEKAALQNYRTWRKWLILGTCACLFLVVGIVGYRITHWKSGCGQTWHEITPCAEGIYFTSNGHDHRHGGTFLWKEQEGKLIKLTDATGQILQGGENTYLYDKGKGVVYLLESDRAKELCKVVIGDDAAVKTVGEPLGITAWEGRMLWTQTGMETRVLPKEQRTVSDFYEIVYETDLSSGQTKELFRTDSIARFANQLMDGKLYYHENRADESGTDRICYYDIKSGNTECVYQEEEDMELYENVVFYEDCMILHRMRMQDGRMTYDKGMWKLTKDGELVFLTRYDKQTAAMDRKGNHLYYVTRFEGRDSVVKLDLGNGEIEMIAPMQGTYTELLMRDGGFYYTEPSYSVGGLFYYDLDSRRATKIHD